MTEISLGNVDYLLLIIFNICLIVSLAATVLFGFEIFSKRCITVKRVKLLRLNIFFMFVTGVSCLASNLFFQAYVLLALAFFLFGASFGVSRCDKNAK